LLWIVDPVLDTVTPTPGGTMSRDSVCHAAPLEMVLISHASRDVQTSNHDNESRQTDQNVAWSNCPSTLCPKFNNLSDKMLPQSATLTAVGLKVWLKG